MTRQLEREHFSVLGRAEIAGKRPCSFLRGAGPERARFGSIGSF